MVKILYIFHLLSITILALACSGDSDDDIGRDYIRVTPELFPAPFNMLSMQVTIEASGIWTAKSDAEWCSIPSGGEGDCRIMVDVDVNPSLEPRRAPATITFTCGNATASLSVSQKGAPLDADILPFIEDKKFKTFLALQYGMGENTQLTFEQALRITKLDLQKYNIPISSTKGIEFFPNIDTLIFAEGQLDKIDLKALKKLRFLQADNNKLSRLDLSGLEKLQKVYCNNNEILEIILAGCPELKQLYCSNNWLTTLDISQNTKITHLIAVPNDNLVRINVWPGFKPSGGFEIPAQTKWYIGENEYQPLIVSN